MIIFWVQFFNNDIFLEISQPSLGAEHEIISPVLEGTDGNSTGLHKPAGTDRNNTISCQITDTQRDENNVTQQRNAPLR